MSDKSDIRQILLFLKEYPEKLTELPPRQFEELIAELLASFGWEVSLTPPTRDGGYDILAVSRDAPGLETSWLIECKRYSRDHKVGVDNVRSLYGVKSHIGLPNAVIVSTSSFTAAAKELAKSRSDLQLVDYEHLLKWINGYVPSDREHSYTSELSFYSCFISHSHKDQEFVERFTARLRTEGIRVWYAPEDILPGQKIYDQVKKAIESFDKLLIVLSSNSLSSEWVRTEIRTARKREKEENRQVLFPISIAPIEDLREWEYFDADSGRDLAVELREYYIPDFSNWQDEQIFETQIAKVIEGLRAADKARR
jgi:hypothetical protein